MNVISGLSVKAALNPNVGFIQSIIIYKGPGGIYYMWYVLYCSAFEFLILIAQKLFIIFSVRAALTVFPAVIQI